MSKAACAAVSWQTHGLGARAGPGSEVKASEVQIYC